MKRIKALLIMTLLGAMMSINAVHVSAASIGTCGDINDDTSASGELVVNTTAYGVFSHIDLPSSTFFGPCSPDDNLGGNVSAAQIGLKNAGGAFVTMGALICNTPKQGWPSGICDGARHIYGEQHGLAIFDYALFDFGTTNTSDHTYQIKYLTSDHRYHWYYDGVEKGSYDMGAGFHPTDSQTASWQFETSDPGSGIGEGSCCIPNDAQLITMEYNPSNNGWVFKTAGSSCDVIDPDVHCFTQSTGIYSIGGYTIN